MRFSGIILFIFSLPVLSQHTSQLGRFEVAYDRGCTPVTVHIQERDTFGNVTRQYEYERGLQETTDTSYTYDTPGVYQIIQYLGEDTSPKSDTLTFTVTESPQPEFTIFQCSESEISVSLSYAYYDSYRIKFTSNDSVDYFQGDSDPQFDYGTNAGSVTVKGFLNDAFPTCAEENTSFNLNQFNNTSINSFNVAEGCIDSLFIQLNGSGYNLLYKYRIESTADKSTYSLEYEGQIVDSAPFYHIKTSNIEDSLCLRISTLNACDESVLFAQTICQSFDFNTSLATSYATYSGEEILLKTGPILGEVLVERKSGNGAYEAIANISNDYLDATQSQFRQSTYRLTRVDTCQNASEPLEVSAPFLKLNDIKTSENIVYLDLKPPLNDLGEYEEYLLLYNKDSSETSFHTYNTEFQLPAGLGDLIYLRGYYLYTPDSIAILSNSISTTYDVKVFVPSAFTPNGDGINDELELFGLPTEEFEIDIYDRWGNVIHQSKLNPVWNGKVDKDNIDEGSYLYRLRFRLETGELKTQVGTFTVLRK